MDHIIGLDGVRSDIAMLRTPDGHSRVELTSSTPRRRSARRRTRRSTRWASAGSCSPSTTSTTSSPACGPRRRARRRGGAVRGPLPALLRPRPRGHRRRAGRAAQLRTWNRTTSRGARSVLGARPSVVHSRRRPPVVGRTGGRRWRRRHRPADRARMNSGIRSIGLTNSRRAGRRGQANVASVTKDRERSCAAS